MCVCARSLAYVRVNVSGHIISAEPSSNEEFYYGKKICVHKKCLQYIIFRIAIFHLANPSIFQRLFYFHTFYFYSHHLPLHPKKMSELYV